METINKRESALQKIREIYGKDAERAMRDHLDVINERFYLWLADLYVPRKCTCDNFDKDGNRICLLKRDETGKCICTGGGFYYSNSARDNEGYEIDIESTVQAIRFLKQSGLIEGGEDAFIKSLPSQMQKDVIAFAKSLQDPEDGYFYHPQWGKNIIPSRLGRDLGWATGILKDLGDMPLYDTKNGRKGSLGAPSGVKPVEDNAEKKDNSTWIEHFRTLEAFKEYLNSLDLKTKSYHSCNQINAQVGQLNARDKQAMADGEAHDNNGDGIPEDGFVAMLESHFNERQNPENGTWEDGVYYYSINGLMKISSSYNSMGIKLNYADKAFESAMKAQLIPADETDSKGARATGSVDVYNPWVAMSAILGNVKKFGTEEEYAKLKKMLKDNIVDLIRVTTAKTKKFMKEDGSFGYTWSYPPSTSQAAPVCPHGIVEGDINGGTIATVGTLCSMCAALGVSVPIYSADELEKFNERIKKNCGYK